MSYVYVLRGSHDGNIGVYSSYKTAYEVVYNYVAGLCEESQEPIVYVKNNDIIAPRTIDPTIRNTLTRLPQH